MRRPLKLHPDSRFTGVQIEVEATCPQAYCVKLSYLVTGDVSEIVLPSVMASERKADLWQHTCFEAFVRASGAEYYEFNFAPTTQWAAYRFSGHRAGKCLAEVNAPAIEVERSHNRFGLRAFLQLPSLPGLSGEARWHLGLSAVIEDKSGNVSYWALAHPPGKPDFHHLDGFAYEVLPVG